MKKSETKIELEQYAEALKNQGKSQNTIKNNVLQIEKYLDSKLSLQEYKEFLINKDVTSPTGELKKMKSSSVNTIINIIKSYNKFKGIEDDIKLIKIQKQYFLQDAFTENEFQRILKQCRKGITQKTNGEVIQNKDLRAEALFTFLARTGCRISEALSIEKDQIKRLKKKGGIISIKGKGEKARDIIVPKTVMEILNEYLKHDIYKDKSSKLFTTRNGDLSRQAAHNMIKRYTGKAKIKKSKGHLHNLRHLFCINAIASGLDITEVAQIVGHSDINTTKIYTAKSADKLKERLEKLM